MIIPIFIAIISAAAVAAIIIEVFAPAENISPWDY